MYQSKPIHCMQNMEQYILRTYFSLLSPVAPRGTLPSITKDHNSLSIRYIVINTDTVKKLQAKPPDRRAVLEVKEA